MEVGRLPEVAILGCCLEWGCSILGVPSGEALVVVVVESIAVEAAFVGNEFEIVVVCGIGYY